MKLVTHYLPSLRSNPSPCELMRVLERLPAAEKAQMLSPSVLFCWGTGTEPAPEANSPGWWAGRFVWYPEAPGKGENLSAPPCLSPGLQCALLLGRCTWNLSSGDSQHHFSWRHCVPWIPMSAYQSTFLTVWGWLCQTASFWQVAEET